MQRLLIDIGNSNIKAALGKDKVIIETFAKTPYKKSNFQSDFNKFIKKHFRFYKDDICSIGISLCDPKYKPSCSDTIKKHFATLPYYITYNSKLSIRIDYPKTLGVDRICSSVAAVNRYKNFKNILVIDYGTATTFNIIINKTFTGGLICPGVQTGLNSLIQNTSLPLPIIEKAKRINLISKNTDSAIISGVIYQTIGLTNFVITELQKRYKGLMIICTGGLGKIFSQKIKQIRKYHPLLVLEGINEILKINIIK